MTSGPPGGTGEQQQGPDHQPPSAGGPPGYPDPQGYHPEPQGYPGPQGYNPGPQGYNPGPQGYPAPAGYPNAPGQPGYPSPPGYPAGPGSSPDPLVPFDFGDWLNKVLQGVRRSWKPLAVIYLLAMVPYLLIFVLISTIFLDGGVTPDLGVFAGTNFVSLVLLIGFVALAEVASFYVVVRDAAGLPYRPADVWAFTVRRAAPMVGWLLLAVLLIGIGLLLLVVPGIYLGVVLAPTLAGVVACERGPISRCFTLVHNHFGAVLGRMLFSYLVLGIAAVILSLLGGLLAFGAPVLGEVLGVLLTLPVTIVGMMVFVVIYAEVRFRENPAVHTAVLAGELDRP